MRVYRGYTLLPQSGGHVEIHTGMAGVPSLQTIVDVAPNLQAARDIIDGWLNAP